MTSYSLIISPLVRDDLKEIYQYGIRNWGSARSSDYIDNLKNHFWTLTEQPKMGIEREELLPNMYSFPVESHVIFYRLEQTLIEVVRVLHSRQDPHKHVK